MVLRTSDHTHTVIGTGAGDPEKLDPAATRETLDHSVMYVFAVALQDGRWHHHDSYTPERAARPDTVRLWRRVETVEDPAWTARYADPDPARRAFGGRAELQLADGEVVSGELAVADAHPQGAAPFARPQYLAKLTTLAEGMVTPAEQDRFAGLVERLGDLGPAELAGLTVAASHLAPTADQGIF